MLAFAAGLLLAAGEIPPVPGLCSAPASENAGKPGCFLSAQLEIAAAPRELFWHIYQFGDPSMAAREASRHRWASVVRAHGHSWLYVIGGRAEAVGTGAQKAVVGPLRVPTDQPLTVRFMESIFPPGMQTRTHSHPGPEAFYVVDGEQCVETPTDRHRIKPGESYVVASGPHLQAAPKGRRNLVIIVQPRDAPWMKLEPQWTPTDYCTR